MTIPTFLHTSVLLCTLVPVFAQAQSVGFGADFMSRYVWRGYDFGDSFSVQPGLTLSAGNFELGTWAAYSVGAEGASANEHDIYATYSIGLGSSASLDITLTDYYFPNGEGESGAWLNLDGNGAGAHWIELVGSLTFPEAFPVTLSAAFMAHNDPDNSLYLEGAVPFRVSDVEMGFTLGLVAAESNFYGVASASLVNLGLSAGKDLQITETFALPLSVAYIVNPTTEKTYLVFGFSLSP